MADHREAEGVSAQFEQARGAENKRELAAKVCAALRVHMQIEEQIFYPAFLSATQDKDLTNEAIVEHAAARKLIEEIEAMDPSDDFYDAKVKVLSEQIEHHVKEEEKSGDAVRGGEESRHGFGHARRGLAGAQGMS
jgi:hypothetical protein